MDDFGFRCAYSMVHVKVISDREMEVDHFDPRRKRRCGYDNLFPAYALCNSAKGDTWPGREEEELGVRFLNPCEETDYGKQLFEDPATHELIGTTTAARYHIEMLDLNNPSLVLHRKERAEMWEIVNSPVMAKTRTKEDEREAAEICRTLLGILETKIPMIPAPPTA